jgi:c-di-GMP-binding flagellar brake protein YcgR
VSELLRSIAARLRTFVINRRYAPRFKARLPLRISLAGIKPKESGPLSLSGFTHDLSETGLAIVVPSIRIGGLYLAGEERVLRLSVDLPSRQISLLGVPTRYEPIIENETKTGYIIGIQIKEIDDKDREEFVKYVQTLHEKL